jgi:hypothetical protein
MKILKLSFLSAIFLLLHSCAVSKWEGTLASQGTINNAIDNVVTDFLHTSKFVKKDSVFNISVTDLNNNVLIIGIAIPSDIVRPSYKNKVGTYDNIFPTQYIIKNGYLFYWNDSTQVITQELFDVLKQYEHIDFSWTELSYEMIYAVHDDGVEGTLYYICKDNYKNYKKTGISNINKRYRIPVLKCNDN